MDKQNLHDRLEQLHREMQEIESIDQNERHTLDQLIADIRKLQEQSEGHTSHEYSRLRDRLKGSVARLEASHPTVTLVMGQVIDQLARWGSRGSCMLYAFRRNIGSQDSGITRSALHESWRRSESA
jgi:hypothetical protein